MTTKLHQLLAVDKGARATTESAVTRAYHDAQRTALFAGLSRIYTPLDDDDREALPPESKTVQSTATTVLSQAVAAWIRQIDLTCTKDATNQMARADVVVDGAVILDQVPVTTLLSIEKMLINVATFVRKLPTLDPEVVWSRDPATGLFRSEPERTVRTKKVPKAFVRAPATDKHPAQVDTFTEDVIVGTWTKTLFSGALPAAEKAAMLERVEKMAAAVKMAREYANRTDIVDRKIGASLMHYLVG